MIDLFRRIYQFQSSSFGSSRLREKRALLVRSLIISVVDRPRSVDLRRFASFCEKSNFVELVWRAILNHILLCHEWSLVARRTFDPEKDQ